MTTLNYPTPDGGAKMSVSDKFAWVVMALICGAIARLILVRFQ